MTVFSSYTTETALHISTRKGFSFIPVNVHFLEQGKLHN